MRDSCCLVRIAWCSDVGLWGEAVVGCVHGEAAAAAAVYLGGHEKE